MNKSTNGAPLMELTVELCDKADINIGVLSYSDAMKLNRLVGLALVRGFDFAIQHGNETGIRELLMHSLGITDSDLGQATQGGAEAV